MSTQANRLQFGAALLYSALGALQVYLSAHALSRYLCLPVERRRARRRYILLLALILSLSIIRFVVYLRGILVNLTDWPDRSPLEPVVDSRIPHCTPAELGIGYAATTMLALVGDAFLVWRAMIIWRENRLLKWLPVTIFIVYFGVCIASSILKGRVWQDNFAAYAEYAAPNPNIELADALLRRARRAHQKLHILDFSASVGVSVVTTVLIIIRLILMKREMDALVEKSDHFGSMVPYRQVITLVLESALPFTLVGITGAISTAFRNSETGKYNAGSAAGVILAVAWYNCLALGPQLIIYRILSGATWTSNPTQYTVQVVSRPIQFAQNSSISNSSLHSISSIDRREVIQTRARSLSLPHPSIRSGFPP